MENDSEQMSITIMSQDDVFSLLVHNPKMFNLLPNMTQKGSKSSPLRRCNKEMLKGNAGEVVDGNQSNSPRLTSSLPFQAC